MLIRKKTSTGSTLPTQGRYRYLCLREDSAERKEARTWEEAGPQWFYQWVGLLLPEQNLFEFEPTITLAIPAGQPKIAQPSNFLWQRPQPIPTSISFARIAHG